MGEVHVRWCDLSRKLVVHERRDAEVYETRKTDSGAMGTEICNTDGVHVATLVLVISGS